MKLIQLFADLFGLSKPRVNTAAAQPRLPKRKGRAPLIERLHPKQRAMVRDWSCSTAELARHFGVTWTTAHRLRIDATRSL